MAACESFCPDLLSVEEYEGIQNDIRSKLEQHFQKLTEECSVAKALYAAQKIDTEQFVSTLQHELGEKGTQNESLTSELKEITAEVFELRLKLHEYGTESIGLKDTIKRLEVENTSFRHQRDKAVDAHDDMIKTVDRRNVELERLREEFQALQMQLQSTVTAKCEALLKIEEVESLRLNLEFREKRMEQEKERMNREIETLTQDLNRQTEELLNARRENTNRRLTLEAQLSGKIEELKIAQQSIENLQEANAAVQSKLEESLRKIMAQHEVEQNMQKAFDDELVQQSKVIKLYKEMSEDAEKKSEQLEKGISELQKLLSDSVEQLDKSETNMKVMEEGYKRKLEIKSNAIEELKLELKNTNALVEGIRREKLDTAIEEMSPAAASVSRLVNSGMTLSQVYMQWANVTEELLVQKQENVKLNDCIQRIIQEIESKAPEVKKLREEHQEIVLQLEEAFRSMDECTQEKVEMQEEVAEHKKETEHYRRECEQKQKEVVDLSRQVCHLLKEIEESNSQEKVIEDEEMDESTPVSSSTVISRHLVTFSSIQELQANNQRLLVLVRELSGKAEEEEKSDEEDYSELKVTLEARDKELEELREKMKRCEKMMERAMRQLDGYKNKCQNLVIALKGRVKVDSEESQSVDGSVSSALPVGTSADFSIDTDNEEIRKLQEKLQNTERTLKELQDETDTYREERQSNDLMLTEQMEKMRDEIRELRSSSSKLVSQLEYSDQRFKIMQTNLTTYKNQISALESKNKSYNSMIVKHEQTIVHMQEDLINTQKKLARAEVSLDNSRRECAILRDAEARWQKEREAQQRTQQGQSMLLANLDLIRSSLERSEVEGRARLESRLDEAMRESGALRRRLQEEQDRFREMTQDLENQTQKAKARLEEEKELAERYKTELDSVRDELLNAKTELGNPSKRPSDSSGVKKPTDDSEKKTRELEKQLTHMKSELESLQQKLVYEKEQNSKFCEISDTLESRLNEEMKAFESYKESTTKRYAESMRNEDELNKKVSALESQLSSLKSGSSQSSAQLSVQLTKTDEELKTVREELDKSKHDLSEANVQLKKMMASFQAAEDKYAQEVIHHSETLESLRAIKNELSEMSGQVDDLRSAQKIAEDALKTGKEAWAETEIMLQTELSETKQRMDDLDSQNAILLKQIDTLGSKLGVLQAQGQGPIPSTQPSPNSSLNVSINTSFTEDEIKSNDQLLQIIKFLRQEKTLALTKYDMSRAENSRLKSQLESAVTQLKEAKKTLDAEKETADVMVITAAQHAELLRKLDTMNSLSDSNRMLRSERDTLMAQIKELNARVLSLEQDLGPLRERNTELSAKVDSLDAENSALRGEAGRLRQRVNFLIERSSKTSPEDWRRLQQERETLARQVATDRDMLTRKDEEARTLRQEKSRLEEQVNSLTRQSLQQLDEFKRQGEELNNLQQRITKLSQEVNETKLNLKEKGEEVAKINEESLAKDASVTDARNKEFQIRKIAKKYKLQFEELNKISEGQKKKLEEMEKALTDAQAAASKASTTLEIPPETQEQFREEGRRQIEMRVAEAETKHSDRVKELVGQVTSSQEEAESLRKENDSLKSSVNDKEERAKIVLKQAREKISQLTKANTTQNERMKLLEGRIESMESGTEDAVRMSALKSQYENRISRLEKENNDLRNEKQNEADAYNQRVSHLQRQLEKYQGSKPSTCSGTGDKVCSDPPTANIKPMAGPTSSSVKQSPSQQSVTPWAGRSDTPFASIRPMSMQTRTVAVLPTSQSASSSLGPATPVLVPPQQQQQQQQQQQLVHTTGSGGSGVPEGLSSSPTSSHADFVPMPTTSSASSGSAVRQAAVPPTVSTISPSTREDPPQTAQHAAESTQDVEMEPEPAVTDAVPETGSSPLQPPQFLDQGSAHKTESQPQPSQQQQPQQQEALVPQMPPTSGTSQQITQTVASTAPQQGQQAVALVLPRVEQQSAATPATLIPGPPQDVEQAAAAPSSQASSSSNTVTTSQVGLGNKRPRDSEGDGGADEDSKTQGKRTRMVSSHQDMLPASSDSCLEVEYQVPTSSQRDQEDEMVDSEEEGVADEGVIEEPDDGQEFDEEVDNTDGYVIGTYRDETDLTSFEEVEGTDIDEENPPDPDNNEAEIMDDSSEVPNQSESEPPVRLISTVQMQANQHHAEASSSGTSSSASAEACSALVGGVGTSRVASSVVGFSRGSARTVPPLARQQQQSQLLLGYEEAGDDSIVPSTPTLFVPRRSDGFGEAVSSPQVPQTRFTFSDTNPPVTRAEVSQAASEGMEDSRMDLSQLEEAGTGRSVPTTPPQVSPQESVEVGQSEGGPESVMSRSEGNNGASGSQTTVPSITVTAEDEATETSEEMPPPELTECDENVDQRDSTGEQSSEQEEGLELADESGDGVSSEGEKSQPPEEVEEGREAEASETTDSQEAPRRVTRAGSAANTARRSARNLYRGQRNRGNMRPTPIVWNEPGSSMSPQPPRGRACLLPSMRGSPDQMRGNFPRGGPRNRRPRGKPKGSFGSPYQMRF